MKFFIPDIDDEERAENIHQAIREWAAETLWPTNARRIRSVQYDHEGTSYSATVGEIHNRINEKVVAILQANNGVYLVCSHNRGVVRGEAMLVGKDEARSVEDFDS